ncbi:MAG: glycosyltransferase involved in cell wall biosynthesis [Bacteriovoracaceae bacterium]|jgi:glycosyltransferase involved in cell wall biosynthesis
MKVLFILHSFNINGVLTQNFVLVKFLLEFIRMDCIYVCAPDEGAGLNLYMQLGIKCFVFKDSEDLNRKLDLQVGFIPDVIFNESLFSLNYVTPQIANKSKHIIRVHEELPITEFNGNWHSQFKNPKDYFDEFSNSSFIFVCENTINYYQEILDSVNINYFLIRGFIDEEKIASFAIRTESELDVDIKGFTILQLGTVYDRKGCKETLRAFSRFLRGNNAPDAQLLFCGARRASDIEIQYEKELRSEIDELGLNDCVRVLRTTENPYPLIKQSSLLTLHSNSECFPTVFLEAMMLGKPVVASDVGGVREQIIPGINGFLFPCKDVEEQAKHFQHVYNNRVDWKAKSLIINELYEANFKSTKSLSDICTLLGINVSEVSYIKKFKDTYHYK